MAQQLNAFLQPTDAPVTSERQTVGYEFDTKNEIQGKSANVSNVKASNITVDGGVLQIVNGGVLTIKDAQGDDVLTYNSDTNKVTFVSGVAGLVQETRFEFGAINGYTGNENFEFSGPAANQFSIVQIDSTGWGTNTAFYFDVVANGDGGIPLVYRLVDLTNGTVQVTNTVGTGGTAGAAVFHRVGPFTPSVGTIQYAYQHKKGGTAGYYPAVVSAAIVAIHL